MSVDTYISDGLHQLLPQFVDRQTLPLILDTQTGDLSVRHRLVRRLPSRLLQRLCTHQVAPQVRGEHLVRSLCHGIQPRLAEIPSLGIGLVIGFLLTEFTTFLRQGSSRQRCSVHRTVRRFDDLDGGQVERDLRLTAQECTVWDVFMSATWTPQTAFARLTARSR
jgi:hypothetical protein